MTDVAVDPIDEPDDVAGRLRAFVSAQLSTASVDVVDVRRVSAGRSRQNWAFDLISRESGAVVKRESLILRRDPLGGLVETNRRSEFAVLRALEDDPLPTPRARWLDATGEWLGRPSLVMVREQGECDYLAVNGDRPLAARRRLAERFCELMAQVHEVDWRRTALALVLTDPGESAAAHELLAWERILRRDQLEPYPDLEIALDWLADRAPRSRGTVLVHADFKPGNVLLDGDRVVALLDWELAHLGDPLEDVAWVTQPLRTREHLIGETWERDDLLAYYSALTGHDIDPSALAWWTTFATFKTAVMQVSGRRSFVEGRIAKPYRLTDRVREALRSATTEEIQLRKAPDD